MDPKEKKVKEEELNVEETHNPAEDQPQNEQAEGTAPLTHEEELEKELEKAQEALEEQKDKYLRLSAEFDNYRKRTLKEKAELILNGGDSIHSIIIDHHSHGVQISPSSNNSYTIMNKGELYQIELQGEMEKIHNARTAAESVGRQVVQAPMPGVILKTYVKKGDLVKRGDPLCVLVAMKMENEIRSVTDGVVKEVFVEDGMKVGLNDRIMVIE